jgi:hypothetical protein
MQEWTLISVLYSFGRGILLSHGLEEKNKKEKKEKGKKVNKKLEKSREKIKARLRAYY